MTAGSAGSGGGRPGWTVDSLLGTSFDPKEFHRRNANAVVIDLLYLFAMAFFTTLLVRGLWPAVIAGIPLATLLYFAWHSTRAFFLGQLAVVVLTAIATYTGVVPL